MICFGVIIEPSGLNIATYDFHDNTNDIRASDINSGTHGNKNAFYIKPTRGETRETGTCKKASGY